jgi:hypothetical protein
LFVCFTELFAKLLGGVSKMLLELHHPSILSTTPQTCWNFTGFFIAAPHPRFPVQSHILSAGGDALTT